MASGTNDITFIVPGQEQPASAPRPGARGKVKASVRVGVERGAGAGAAVRVTARPGEDVVVLSVANGPTLVLHPADARDLLLAQSASVTRSALVPGAPSRGTGAPAASEIIVPARLGWPGLEAEATRGSTRGWMGQAVLSGFQILTGVAKDPAAKLAAAAVTKKVDSKVDAGVYQLSAQTLEPLKGSGTQARRRCRRPRDGGPMLVLVHGTFSDTVGTFSKLWAMHSPVLRQLFASYGDRVYGLDHPTLGFSPIANALTLVRALPAGARVHLLTHSRGGLVAEVLARACAGAPLGNDVLALFAGDGYAEHRSDLRALFKEAQAKGIRCDRVVRVACPARGTLLASKRLDAYISVLQWCLELASIPVVPEVVDFLHEVALRRAQPAELPGLEAMTPDSPVVTWLNGATDTIPGELRVIAGDMEGDAIGSWAKTLLCRCLLLDRQRPRRADALDVRRCPAGEGGRRQRRALPARQGRQGLALQLLHQRPHGAGDHERAARRQAGRLRRDRPAVVGRRGRERHARRRRRRALARRRRGRGDRRGRAAGGVLPARHPRLQPQEGRRAGLARLSLRQRPRQARLGSGDGGERRSRRADRQRLRRPDRAPRRQPRGDLVRLRLAPSGRGRGAPPRRRRRRRAEGARREPAAGADRRPLDGRPRRANDGARAAEDLAANDGARRRALPDARHAERRLVVADADAVRRRHLRQRARRARLAVRQRRRAPPDGRHARLHAAAGGAARPRLAPRSRRELAAPRRRRPGAPARARALARRRRAENDLPMERAAAGGPRPGGRAAAPARRAGGRAARREEDAPRRRPRAVHAGRNRLRRRRPRIHRRGRRRRRPRAADERAPARRSHLEARRVARRPADGGQGVPGVSRAADDGRDEAPRRVRCDERRRPLGRPGVGRRRGGRRGERRAQPPVARPPAVDPAVDAGRRARRRVALGRGRATSRASAPRPARCTCRCSTPTSSSCTSRSSSATTARSR